MFWKKTTQVKKKRSFKFILNLATIISCLLGCIRLIMWHAITTQTATWVMIGVVLAVAIGKPLAKLFLVGVAVFLLLRTQSGSNNVEFNLLLKDFLVAIVLLVGLYIMFSALRKK